MPTRSKPYCVIGGCPERAVAGSAYCQTHEVKRPLRSALKASGSTRQWRRVRALYLMAHPICEWHDGCWQVAVAVDHIIARSSGGGDHPSNLLALCAAHHYESHKLPRSYDRPPEVEDLGGFA